MPDSSLLICRIIDMQSPAYSDLPAKMRFIPEPVSSSMHIATLHSSAHPNLKKTVNICKS